MKRRIILIEDDPPIIELYEEILKKAGFEIETLRWGKEGLKRLEEIKEKTSKKPVLILLDLILPDVNGIEILRKAKGEEELKDIPFFVLTNYTDPKLEKEVWKLGAKEYLVKANFTPSQLVKIIKNHLKKH